MEPTTSQTHLSDETLSAWLDGHLDEAENLAADRHLGSCRTCAARYAGLRSLRDALRHLDAIPPPRDFRLGPDGRVRRAGSRPTALPPARGAWLAGRALSAAVTFVGIVLLAFSIFGAVPNQANNATATRSSASSVVNASAGDSTCQGGTCGPHVPTTKTTVTVTETKDASPGLPAAQPTPTLTTGTPVTTATPIPTSRENDPGTTNHLFGFTPLWGALLGVILTLGGISGWFLLRRR